MKNRIMKSNRLKIVLFGDPVLREVAKPVTVFHHKLHALIDSMAGTLFRRDDGAALAAPQVGVLKRIVVIDYENEYLELINPEITASGGKQKGFEGCLSYPGYIGSVPRFETVTVKFQDRDGNEHIIERSGNMARCLQHEIDHLDGVLFIDRMDEDFLTHSDTDEEVSLEAALGLANGKTITGQPQTV
ncbi:MAG: peptide deformylase [Ignavibacteriales bacterium]